MCTYWKHRNHEDFRRKTYEMVNRDGDIEALIYVQYYLMVKSTQLLHIMVKARIRMIEEDTLLPIIQKHVENGSRIYSDGWAAYTKLNKAGYT